MKHIIVIETVDPSEPGGKLLPKDLAEGILGFIEGMMSMEHGICFVQGSFNQHSAIDAVHEMYNVPREGIEV